MRGVLACHPEALAQPLSTSHAVPPGCTASPRAPERQRAVDAQPEPKRRAGTARGAWLPRRWAVGVRSRDPAGGRRAGRGEAGMAGKEGCWRRGGALGAERSVSPPPAAEAESPPGCVSCLVVTAVLRVRGRVTLAPVGLTTRLAPTFWEGCPGRDRCHGAGALQGPATALSTQGGLQPFLKPRVGSSPFCGVWIGPGLLTPLPAG